MTIWILSIALGGALGACLRWSAGRAVARHTHWPGWAGTLGANLAGCLLIGLFAADPELPQPLLVGGLCGALTTFSSFALDLALMLMSGRAATALLLAAASVIGGGLLTWAGLWVGGAA